METTDKIIDLYRRECNSKIIEPYNREFITAMLRRTMKDQRKTEEQIALLIGEFNGNP